MSRAMRVSFCWPGGDLDGPSPDEVFGAMTLPYDGNWGPCQPVAEMAWYRASSRVGEPAARMILVRHPDLGWYFEYSDNDRGLGSVVAGGPAGHVRHWSWGEEEWFRAECFVPEDVARRVGADFMAEGQPSEVVGWAGVEEAGVRLRGDQYGR